MAKWILSSREGGGFSALYHNPDTAERAELGPYAPAERSGGVYGAVDAIVDCEPETYDLILLPDGAVLQVLPQEEV